MANLYIDLETTVEGGPKGDSPEAHWKNNEVLLYGWTWDNNRIPGTTEHKETFLIELEALETGDWIIAHNLKFDLKYLIREFPNIPWHTFNYVCTMGQVYKSFGQRYTFYSLEESCKLYSVPFKKSLDLGDLLKQGTKMQDIPKKDLEQYLKDDVLAVQELESKMDQIKDDNHLLGLARMELNGIPIDIGKARQLMCDLIDQEDEHREAMQSNLVSKLVVHGKGSMNRLDPVMLEKLKFNAPRTISYLLTGEPSTGLTIGTKTIKFDSKNTPYLSTQARQDVWGGELPNHLGYPVPEKILAQFTHIPYIDHALKYRKAHKLLNTYLGPMLEQAKLQGCIYPKLNTCLTKTTRLSSSQPNGQNMPEIIREVCEGEHQLLEMDFKQLEIVAVAVLSKDTQLIDDLNNGEDIHYNVGKGVYNWRSPLDMRDDERKIVKGVVFGTLYGGTAYGLSESTGVSKKRVADIIRAFYIRYPDILRWQESFYKQVVKNMKPHGHKLGEQTYDSLVKVRDGLRLYFEEHPSPAWLVKKSGRKLSFKPTQTKNYPVQGFAGGVIVMETIKALNEIIDSKREADIHKLRMTVHDSILIDTKRPTQLVSLINYAVSLVQKDLNLPVPLIVDTKTGSHWQ